MAQDEVERIVMRARAAQPAWEELGPSERARRLAPLKERVLDRADAIADCLHEEVNKPAVEGLLGEVLPSADLVQYWTRAMPDLLQPADVDFDPIAYPGKTGTIFREARGVVGVIMPWNFPIALPLRTIVPALLAGNAVVFKPSEVAPRSGALVAGLFAGLVPDGVLEIAQGGGEVGAALCSAGVDLVVFTGSVGSGRAVARACAEKLIPCSLELGGKDAAIVLADADLDRAANGVVWGGMMNAGQNCASIERVYVDKTIAEAFTAKVCAVVSSLKPGIDVAPLATSAQRAIVEGHVETSTKGGAEVLARGSEGSAGSSPPRALRSAPDGERHSYPPTVVRVFGDDSALMRDETFGPVLPIAAVDGVEEAVARANASRYGLTASIWTRDEKKAQRIARRLHVGVVTINNHGLTGAIPAAPWGGRGETGWGITGSPLALDSLTRPRFVLVDRNRAKRELWWFPYTPALTTIASSMATLRCSSRGFFARARALLSLLWAMMARAREG
ncbi:MAG: aldehyde dehydrogenase family protein [Polyangiaceae bacterium]